MGRGTTQLKSAIVTGAAGGIGQGIARSLQVAGYRVGLFDYDLEQAERAAADIAGSVAVQVDVTDPASVASAVAEFGQADVLVNNAGITAAGGMRQPVETFRRILDVNVTGAFIMTQAVMDGMIERASGSIVNITSSASIAAVPLIGAYGPSKSALTNLTKAMALELAPAGIRVNAIAPGFIAAGLGARSIEDPQLRSSRIGQVPAGILGSAEDIANAVVFLCSDAARYIHGHEIVIDGALTLTAQTRTFQREVE